MANELHDDRFGRYETYKNDVNAYTSNALNQDLNAARQLGQTAYGAGYGQNQVKTPAQGAQVQSTQLAPAQGYQAAGFSMPQDMQGPQAQLLEAMRQRAAGSFDTQAQQQLRQGTQNALAQQMAVAASTPNTNAALARRQYAQSAADATQTQDMASHLLRAQEMQQGQQDLSAYLGQARGLDLGQASQQAQMQQDAAQYNAAAQNQFAQTQGGMSAQNALLQAQLANAAADRTQQAQLANQGYNLNALAQQQARNFGALGLQGDVAQNQAQSALLLRQMQNQGLLTAQQIATGQHINDLNFNQRLAGGAISGAGTALAGFLK